MWKSGLNRPGIPPFPFLEMQARRARPGFPAFSIFGNAGSVLRGTKAARWLGSQPRDSQSLPACWVPPCSGALKIKPEFFPNLEVGLNRPGFPAFSIFGNAGSDVRPSRVPLRVSKFGNAAPDVQTCLRCFQIWRSGGQVSLGPKILVN